MTWFKVDDKLHDHHKTRSTTLAAMGLWAIAGSWCADNLTNGFVPDSVLTRWRNATRTARELETAGFWTRSAQNGEDGWQFNKWEEYQPSRADVEAKRAEARERMARVRANKTRTSEPVRANVPRSSPNVRVTPSRPVPTRPDQELVADEEQMPTPVGDSLVLADSPNSQTLIAEWLDHCRQPPPGQVKGQIAKVIKTMLDEGIDYERVRAGLAEWNTKDVHPSVLPSIVHGIGNREPRNGSQRATDDLFGRAMQRARARDGVA